MPVSRRTITRVAAWSALTLLVSIAAPAVSASTPGAGWRALGTHPQAAAQPTGVGRQIRDLEILDGRLYAGFGDYGVNTGPIGINPFDIARGAFLGVRHESSTHQVAVWRFSSYGLVAPDIDPLQDLPDDPNDPRAGFSWTSDGLIWSRQVIGPALHVFDYTESPSGRWIAGSSQIGGTGRPTMWRRSGDEGWTVHLAGDDDPATGADRYYWVAAVAGVPYIQARGSSTVRPVRCFDQAAGAWRPVPGLTGEFHQSSQPQHVQVLGSTIVSASGPGLRVLDPAAGAIRQVMMPDRQRVKDLYVRGDALYTLTDSAIHRSLDGGSTFAVVAEPRPDATALAVGDSDIFVGTSAAQLWAHPHQP